MHSDQIDIDPKNRPVQARLAFDYAQIMKSRLDTLLRIGLLLV
jgi:hypothetical protein